MKTLSTPTKKKKKQKKKKNNETFSEEMHLKIPLLSQGLKLLNLKRGGIVSALDFFIKIDLPPSAFWHKYVSIYKLSK